MWSIRCVACVALRCAERARVVEASLGALGEACPRGPLRAVSIGFKTSRAARAVGVQ